MIALQLLGFCSFVAFAIGYPTLHEGIDPFVAGSKIPAIDALHSCALQAIPRHTLTPNIGYFGGGSIVSRNRVLTAAHVVHNASVVNAWFYLSDVTNPDDRQTTSSIWVQPMFNFDPNSRKYDVAVVLFPNNIFPQANVIAISIPKVKTSDGLLLAGYGFTSEEATVPSEFPIKAAHNMTASCARTSSRTHFCATAVAPAVICPGDNGSGLYRGAKATARLVGVLSILNPWCQQSETSVFTNLADSNVRMFLMSQDIWPKMDEIPSPQPEPEPEIDPDTEEVVVEEPSDEEPAVEPVDPVEPDEPSKETEEQVAESSEEAVEGPEVIPSSEEIVLDDPDTDEVVVEKPSGEEPGVESEETAEPEEPSNETEEQVVDSSEEAVVVESSEEIHIPEVPEPDEPNNGGNGGILDTIRDILDNIFWWRRN